MNYKQKKELVKFLRFCNTVLVSTTAAMSMVTCYCCVEIANSLESINNIVGGSNNNGYGRVDLVTHDPNANRVPNRFIYDPNPVDRYWLEGHYMDTYRVSNLMCGMPARAKQKSK